MFLCRRCSYYNTLSGVIDLTGTTCVCRIMGWKIRKKHLQMSGFQEILLRVPWTLVLQCFSKTRSHFFRLRRLQFQGTTAWAPKWEAASPSPPWNGNACCHGEKRSCSKWPGRSFWTGQGVGPHLTAATGHHWSCPA